MNLVLLISLLIKVNYLLELFVKEVIVCAFVARLYAKSTCIKSS